MRKKYLSALLFGALLFASAGTFTSCKDYDDDIKNLQEQVDGLATKDDMEAKLSQMETAVNDAKATAEEALEKANAAGDADKIAELETRIADLEKVLGDIDAMKEEIQNALDDQIANFRTEMEELIAQVEGLVGKLADMVTSVELVYSNSSQVNDGYNQDLELMSVIEKSNVFGEGLPGAITFTEGNQTQAGASFIVRVSPTNAVITPEMISLINGEGKTLDNFLNVDKVERYNKNILGDAVPSRAEDNSGLWKVTVSLKNYDKDSFDEATMVKDGAGYKYIKYAVEVNNTLDSEATATRDVISAYDLQIMKADFKPLSNLNYWVNDKNVTEIRNRYATTETTAQGGLNIATGKDEWKWISDPDVAPALKSDGSLETGSKANAVQANGTPNDNRSNVDYIFPAVQGEAFTISIDGNAYNTSSYDRFETPSEIKGMYVTLDTRNAVESEPSEFNAWKNYSYTGLDQVVEGSSIQVTIDGENVINDIIGLRVYAVNMDGTLVDPDGRAFYVRLGNAATEWNAVNTIITPDKDDDTTADKEQSATQNVTLSKLTDASTMTWETDKVDDKTPAFHVYFVDKDNKPIYNTKDGNIATAAFDKVAKIYTVPTQSDWKLYEDDKAYNGTLTIKNAKDFVLATMDVTMTKVLPTAVPDGFSVKTAQVAEGIYNCYMIPDNWAASAAKEGTMKMTEVFNFGEGKADQYEITFDASKKDGNKDVAVEVGGDETLTVVKDYIDNETAHETTAAYNYGQISSKKNAKGEYEDWIVEATTFSTIYNCIYNDTYTWKWANNEQLKEVNAAFADKDDKGNYKNATPSTTLTYGIDYTMQQPGGAAMWVDTAIFGTSAWDSEYNALLSRAYMESLKITEATLTSDANGKEEYFEVVLDGNHIKGFEAINLSSTTNPTADVPSTLTIKAKDMYNHDVVIKLPMTVKKR